MAAGVVLAAVLPFLPQPKSRRLIKLGNRRKHLAEHPYCEYRPMNALGGLTCGKLAVTVHHKMFRSAGGGDEDSNLESLCDYHHRVRHNVA